MVEYDIFPLIPQVQPSRKHLEYTCELGIFRALAKVRKVTYSPYILPPVLRVFCVFFSFRVNYILVRKKGRRERERTPLPGEKIVFNKNTSNRCFISIWSFYYNYIYILCCSNLTFGGLTICKTQHRVFYTY